MDAVDRIDAYLEELERQLRVPRRARRRVLTEVREHLLDAAEAEQRWAAEGLVLWSERSFALALPPRRRVSSTVVGAGATRCCDARWCPRSQPLR
jgi:hypothetical protein